MLLLAHKLHQLDFGKLMAVYEEGNLENGAFFWPELPEGQRLALAQSKLFEAEQAAATVRRSLSAVANAMDEALVKHE